MATLFTADDSIGSNCKSCGAFITPTAKFCPDCGATQTSLPANAAAPSVPSDEPSLKPVDTGLTSDDESLHQDSQPRSVVSHWLVWLGITIVVVALVSVGSWAWLLKHPLTAKAQYALGKKYYYGDGVKKDLAEAVRWCRKAADQGYAPAQSGLGARYATGEGVQQNLAEAAIWFRKAADQGYAEGQFRLGLMYAVGLGGLAKDDAQAFAWLQRAANQGDAKGEAYLANMFFDGRGVTKDTAQAVNWWRKAAEQGDAMSQYNLAVCYEKGNGVQQDDTQAIVWYQKASAQGYEHAKEPLNRLLAKQQAAESQAAQASATNRIQFRGLHAGSSKAEVSSYLTHPGDKLECKPEKYGEQTCHCALGDAIGNISFSPSEKLFHFEFTFYHADGKSIYDEMIAQMGEGENVEHGELAGTILEGMREVKWKSATTVPWLLDRAKQYPSVELTLTFGSAWPKTELTDWGYYADREGLTAPDPNQPHPTVEGRFSMYGVRGGEQVSQALVALRHYDGTGCQIKQEDSSTECHLTEGALEWNLSFYPDALSSFTLRFSASDWSEQVAYLKKTFGTEPTDTDRTNSFEALTWKSASSIPCLLAPEKKCPIETFILSRTKGKPEAQANYLYVPVMNEQIRAKATRYQQR